jgi:DNA-binding NarL/FixJ family response regulator
MSLAAIKVAIADDHSIIRDGLKMLFGENNGIAVVAEAATGKDAIKMTARTGIDVLLLDINLPDKSGIEVLETIRRVNKELPILIFSMCPEEQYALRCLKAGANGYINKKEAYKEVIKAIHAVVKGKKYITPIVAELLADQLSGNINKAPHEMLSAREFQVFSMITKGLTVGEIAEEISLSVKTISMYRARVLSKLSLRNNAEIMRYAIQNNLAA